MFSIFETMNFKAIHISHHPTYKANINTYCTVKRDVQSSAEWICFWLPYIPYPHLSLRVFMSAGKGRPHVCVRLRGCVYVVCILGFALASHIYPFILTAKLCLQNKSEFGIGVSIGCVCFRCRVWRISFFCLCCETFHFLCILLSCICHLYISQYMRRPCTCICRYIFD